MSSDSDAKIEAVEQAVERVQVAVSAKHDWGAVSAQATVATVVVGLLTSILAMLVSVYVSHANDQQNARQLVAVIEQSKATQKQADAALKNAEAASDQAQTARQQAALAKQQVEQLSSSVKVAQESVDTASGQLQMSRDQLALVKETSRAQLRPYLYFRSLMTKLEPGKLVWDMSIENAGATPAMGVATLFDASLISGAPISVNGPTHKDCSRVMEDTYRHIDKNVTTKLDTSLLLTQQDVEMIKAGIKNILLRARACYKDSLGDTYIYDYCIIVKGSDSASVLGVLQGCEFRPWSEESTRALADKTFFLPLDS